MATNEQRREAAKRKLERQLQHREQRARRNRMIGAGATVGVVVLVVGVIVFIANQSDEDPAAAEEGNDSGVSIPSERAELPERSEPLSDPAECSYPDAEDNPAPQQQPQQEEPPKADKPQNNDKVSTTGTVAMTLETSAGDIDLELNRELAPCTVHSMINLAEQDFYNDTDCHRLVMEQPQVLQCGDPTGSGAGGPGYSFADETFEGLSYGRGMVAMANSGEDTNGSQFFMVYGEADQLPPDYTVFGSITDDGLEVLDKVARAGIDEQGQQQQQMPQQQMSEGPPANQVTIKDVTVDA